MVNKVVYGTTVLVDLTEDTVNAEHLVSGYTAHGKDGEPITGTYTPPESLDTSDATAKETDICYGKTAYVNGEKVTGSLREYNERQGAGSVWGDTELAQGTVDGNGMDTRIGGAVAHFDAKRDFYIRAGSQIHGVFKAGTATAADVLAGKTFTSVSGNNLTGTLVTQTYRTGTDVPDDSIGDDGDLYLVVSA